MYSFLACGKGRGIGTLASAGVNIHPTLLQGRAYMLIINYTHTYIYIYISRCTCIVSWPVAKGDINIRRCQLPPNAVARVWRIRNVYMYMSSFPVCGKGRGIGTLTWRRRLCKGVAHMYE